LEENIMKKDLIFAPIMLVVGILLFLLRATGMAAHIAISVVGVAALIAYTVLTKKEWKTPALEIGMRVSYGLALISGIVIKISYIAAVAVLHKIFAALFVVLLVVTVTCKFLPEQKKEEN
jgi:CDP-diglyceride synthetase